MPCQSFLILVPSVLVKHIQDDAGKRVFVYMFINILLRVAGTRYKVYVLLH